MKIRNWFENNIIFILTLFLMAFIPLFPKLPLFDVRNTWVYIRAEDFMVVLVIFTWILLLLRRKVSLKTPLTIPILIFWITGAVATIHGILLIFPTLANVFPNVAFLSYLRRIEYLSLFFVAYSAMRDKRYLSYVIAVLSVTFLLVVAYGVGQRYLGFPAYLTMNEEFAKGEPIRLSQLSRVPSTFAGHYDLAAYLVLVIPILTSLIFGVRNWFLKAGFLLMTLFGFLLMFMTVSRVSFFVLFISLGIVLLFQKKKIVFLLLPGIVIMLVLLFSFTPALFARYGNTLKEVDVLVDAKTGAALGEAKVVSNEYFKDKIIIQDYVLRDKKVENTEVVKGDEIFASSAAVIAEIVSDPIRQTPGIVPYYILPEKVILLVPANAPTGENLPQGTGYINLSLSPVKKKIGEYFYEQKNDQKAAGEADVVIVNGNYLLKRAAAYDLSFTTRFQGEWPNAIKAFMRNVFFGSGYGSISLAIDNNYFRILGEVGLFGTIAFLAIFVTIGIYIRKLLPYVDSAVARSFIVGFAAGLIGLCLNAFLIDVFEASKVAFLLWLLTGITLGLLTLYHNVNFNIYKELRNSLTSTYAVIVYLGILVILLYSPMIGNYFVGDDFTWFRWVAEDANIARFFTHADGFFYRPGTKLYFLLMYSVFWLNQAVYHIISIFLHFIVTALVFLLAKKVLKNYPLSVLTAFFFVLLSGYSESIFWISSTGYLFTAVFSLSSLLLFIIWQEKKNMIYIVLSSLSMSTGMLFHELGVITPFLLLLYVKFADKNEFYTKRLKKIYSLLAVLPLMLYGLVRLSADSHWFSGDYNYNLFKLPFNIFGNTFGYLMLSILGPMAISFNQTMRNLMREQMALAAIFILLFIASFYFIFRFLEKRISIEDRKVLMFSTAFFLIGLLPFLGLGNLTSRYSYVSSIGVVFLISYGIRKLYHYMLVQGKDIAIGIVSVVMTLFILLHLMQIQQIHGDWHTAGQKAERFLIAIDEVYADYWATTPMQFYFINVPIKTGQAWIFPVGLKDALWFSFRNPNIDITHALSVEKALSEVDGSRNQKVYEFDQSGTLIEHRKKILFHEEN